MPTVRSFFCGIACGYQNSVVSSKSSPAVTAAGAAAPPGRLEGGDRQYDQRTVGWRATAGHRRCSHPLRWSGSSAVGRRGLQLTDVALPSCVSSLCRSSQMIATILPPLLTAAADQERFDATATWQLQAGDTYAPAVLRSAAVRNVYSKRPGTWPSQKRSATSCTWKPTSWAVLAY